MQIKINEIKTSTLLLKAASHTIILIPWFPLFDNLKKQKYKIMLPFSCQTLYSAVCNYTHTAFCHLNDPLFTCLIIEKTTVTQYTPFHYVDLDEDTAVPKVALGSLSSQ